MVYLGNLREMQTAWIFHSQLFFLAGITAFMHMGNQSLRTYCTPTSFLDAFRYSRLFNFLIINCTNIKQVCLYLFKQLFEFKFWVMYLWKHPLWGDTFEWKTANSGVRLKSCLCVPLGPLRIVFCLYGGGDAFNHFYFIFVCFITC